MEGFAKDHAAHGANPVFNATGWNKGEHTPCGYTTCPQNDEHFSEQLYDREMGAGKRTTINPRTAPLVAHEPSINMDTVDAYAKNPPKKTPRVMEHNGQLHIVDGHHQLLGAWTAGRDVDVDVV